MNGDDFVKFAGYLAALNASGHTECQCRTVISRTYYGAFHFASDVIRQLGGTVLANANGHRQAIELLKGTEVSEAVDAGRIIEDLQSARIKADYRPGSVEFFKPANARLSVEDAENAIGLLKKCLEEPARGKIAAKFKP